MGEQQQPWPSRGWPGRTPQPEQPEQPEQPNVVESVGEAVGEALHTLNRPAAPELVTEPTLSLVQDDLHPGITVHVTCEHPLPGPAELVVQAPHHEWRQYAKDTGTGFNLPLAVAGTYRLTLRQLYKAGEWREQAHLVVEVLE